MTERKEFDHGLSEMRELLVAMGERVQWALQESMEALRTMDAMRARQVILRDKELNQLEKRVDDVGTALILKQQPVAKDLRKILVGFKIASDLERMGDLSKDVANVVLRLEGQTLIKPLIDLPMMAEKVQLMVRDALFAFVKEDVPMAEAMAKSDDDVDALYSRILRDLFALMIEEPQTVNQAMLLCFVGRYIERIADHATNIGEGVVYLVKNFRAELN